MRTLILIVILQLTVLLIKTNGDYSFGDIIAFERLRVCSCQKKAAYKHYAVYVGDEHFEGKKEGDNIFEFTSTLDTLKNKILGKEPLINCIFTKLDKNSYPVDNYLDNFKQYKPGSKAEIIERINEKYKDCGPYGLSENNCEHLATYVRYGESVAIQHGTFAQGKCKINPNINVKEILEKIGQDNNKACDLVCPISDSKRGPG